jgi:hypothetical protein
MHGFELHNITNYKRVTSHTGAYQLDLRVRPVKNLHLIFAVLQR